MARPINCWEYFRCGREKGGKRVAELGVCPAATCNRDGTNGGIAGGRVRGATATAPPTRC